MSERYFGRAADLLGLVAYWTVMYGRLPDRRLLQAVYDETGSLATGRSDRPRLSLVPPSGDAPRRKRKARDSIDAAA